MHGLWIMDGGGGGDGGDLARVGGMIAAFLAAVRTLGVTRVCPGVYPSSRLPSLSRGGSYTAVKRSTTRRKQS